MTEEFIVQMTIGIGILLFLSYVTKREYDKNK
jgi:hypothetical protein